jgi:DNA mismatch repair protein MutS
MALVKEYFELVVKYESLYGKKTFLLMQVGSFFEVYGKREKGGDGQLSGSEIREFTRVCDLNIAEKHVTLGSFEVVMAGFKDIMIEKYLKKIQDAGFTAVVYTQDEKDKTSRALASVFSPGTYFSNDSNGPLTNSTTCIWVELFESKSKVLREMDRSVIVGIANIDVFTGKTSMFQFQEKYTKSPTTFDELERFISIHCPSEVIFISNLPEKDMNDILQYASVEAKMVHKICLSSTCSEPLEHQLSLVKNCEKQTYQREIISRFYPQMDFETFSHKFLYENHLASQAFCYLLDFIYQHNIHLVNKLHEPIFENCSDRLILANHSLKQLNILEDGSAVNCPGTNRFSSVSKMLNLCTTSMGKRKFAHDLVNPTTRADWLQREYDVTEHMLATHDSSSETFQCLKEIKDLSKLKRQIVMKKISPQDLYQLYNNLKSIQKMATFFSQDADLKTYFQCVNNLSFEKLIKDGEDICSFLDEKIVWDECKDMNDIRDVERNFLLRGTNAELDQANEDFLESKDKLDAILEYLNRQIGFAEKKFKDGYLKYHETEKSSISFVATKRRALKLKEQISKSNEDGSGLFLSFNSSFSGKKVFFQFNCTADELVLTNQSATNSFVSCPKIDQLREEHTSSKAEMKGLLVSAFYQIISHMDAEFQSKLDNIIQFVTIIDVLHCKMTIAKKYNYCKPQIVSREKAFVDAEDLRHCIIEQIQQNEIYVANDVSLGNLIEKGQGEGETDGVLLYGTNAVGKTSFIRSIGIAVIMAQAGLYVPARVFKFNPYKYIFTRILGNDNLFKGLSTFAVEMYELNYILRLADKDSLVLGDELCSGTESTSAISIFVAGIQWLQKKGSSFIFATHLHEIVDYDEISELSKSVKQMHMEVIYDREKDALVYDRKLREGSGANCYGLEVCKSLNLPDEFLKKAHEVRMKYRPEQANVLSLKTSHFNSQKVVGLCEKCGVSLGKEVHHLQHQREADQDGIINREKTNGISPFHKNHLANLMTLCEKCHDSIHKEGVQHKKVKTSKGKKVVSV